MTKIKIDKKSIEKADVEVATTECQEYNNGVPFVLEMMPLATDLLGDPVLAKKMTEFKRDFTCSNGYKESGRAQQHHKAQDLTNVADVFGKISPDDFHHAGYDEDFRKIDDVGKRENLIKVMTGVWIWGMAPEAILRR